jgi:hypothetical protein
MADRAHPPAARARALSIRLAQVHADLRDQLADARANLDHPQRTTPVQLRHHCLAFCQSLTTHHRGEEVGLFAELIRQRPDLEPTVAKLIEDHHLISGLIERVSAVLAEGETAGTAEQRAALGRELDGLAAIASSHFAYEERAIGNALDHDGVDTSWGPAVFGLKR